MSGRVHIHEASKLHIFKTTDQIIDENNNILEFLGTRGKVMETDIMIHDDKLKAAMQDRDSETFQALLARKKDSVSDKTIGTQKHVSLNFGVVGVGQAGSRIAQIFYNLGYQACVINTAKQDLDLLDIEEQFKFFIDYSIGGAGRQLEVGRAAVESNIAAIREFIAQSCDSCDAFVLCVSGGGGSGAGSAPTMISLLNTFDKPLIVIYVLPGSADDSQSKHNAITTLAEITDISCRQKISSLVLVDNAKIEIAYPDLSQAQFWKTANEAIVQPLHMFNSLTAKPTDYEALDSMDFSLALLESGGCTLFGSNAISKELYEANELALVESIIDNLDRGLLAGGFALKESQIVGILVTAKQSVLETIPHNHISFIFKYIAEEYASARTFRGVYAVNNDNDDIVVHFIFSGLGLPKDRVDSLKREATKHMEVLASKKRDMGEKMSIDMGKDRSTAAADNMLNRLKKNKGAIGQLLKNHKIIERKR